MLPIRLENLTKRYVSPRQTVLAVDDVSLTVNGGELFFLLGPSGCGKTTLLRMLAGFVEPTAGRIHFGDRDVTFLPPERRDAAMVFQNYALWPHMTVARNVAFGPQVRKMPSQRRRQVVGQLLQMVRVADKANAKPMELSGGQQQRVALARALAVSPACLLLDEPLSNLDAALRSAMRWEIRRLVKSSGITAVYVTHDQAEALAIADRIALMKDGRLVQVATGAELYERPNSRFVAEFLGEANFIPGTVVGPACRGDAVASPVEGPGGTGVWPVQPMLIVQTPIGPLIGRCDKSLAAGRKVVCCIRPESLRLGGTDRSDAARGVVPAQSGSSRAGTGRTPVPPENVLSGQLTEWTHLGESARYRLRTVEGVDMSGSAMPARRQAEVGQQVRAAVAPENVIVLEE